MSNAESACIRVAVVGVSVSMSVSVSVSVSVGVSVSVSVGVSVSMSVGVSVHVRVYGECSPSREGEARPYSRHPHTPQPTHCDPEPQGYA